MCGIIGAISNNNITQLLLDGLKRLEYRGYDSSGIAVIDKHNNIKRTRKVGKVNVLTKALKEKPLSGNIGIAHTRWATHGKPSKSNAHPHICNQRVSVVHNGIIENYLDLKFVQQKNGFVFTSETDTEVIVHAIDAELENGNNLLQSVQASCSELAGSYALGVVATKFPNELVAICDGTPLVIGILVDKTLIASDINALLPLTKKFIFLEDGDLVHIKASQISIYNKGKPINRPVITSSLKADTILLGHYDHYMQKEIFEQPKAVADTLEGRCSKKEIFVSAFGYQAEKIFKTIKQVQIIACGTSYHAGLVAKYWFEDIIKMPCAVEVASEYRYRHPIILDATLIITLSQSGETADTVEALKLVLARKNKHLKTLTICNTAASKLTRLSDLSFLTHAGPEIGVASTKTFSAQLVSLALLMCAIGKTQKTLSEERELLITRGLRKLPRLIQSSLTREETIARLAKQFANKHNALFLGRGVMYPIAKEGALKLKEISYIHAEAYPAGELKHGPIALVDNQTPIIAIAPNDELLNKLKTNLAEVKARGGQMVVFEDIGSKVKSQANMSVVTITQNVGPITAPIVFNVALQLLSYHVALILGTDVDKPRNLAKSVTVE